MDVRVSLVTRLVFRQFALTISAAMLISTINALTLSPALCGILCASTERKFFFFYEWPRYLLDV